MKYQICNNCVMDTSDPEISFDEKGICNYYRNYGSKHPESIYTKFFQAYILPTKFDFDKRRAHLSSLMLAGQMTRNTALDEMEKPLYDEKELKEHLEYVSKKLGLTQKEFDEIMNTPIRKYEEFSPEFPKIVYKLENKWFNLILGIKRKIVKRKKIRTITDKPE